MYDRGRANQVSGGIFFIGLALLAVTNLWWPGIMFVLGAAAIAQGLAEGRGWLALQGGLLFIGLGLAFLPIFSGIFLPLLFVTIGASLLLGRASRPPFMREKAKNDMRLAEPESYEDNGEHYELGDDGEMVKVKNDERRVEAQRR